MNSATGVNLLKFQRAPHVFKWIIWQKVYKGCIYCPCIGDSGESIFDYEYLREFEAKIEKKVSGIVYGTYGEVLHQNIKKINLIAMSCL
jgi:hypothetical protein